MKSTFRFTYLLGISLFLYLTITACSPLHRSWVRKTHNYHWLENRQGINYFTGFALFDPERKRLIYHYNGEKYFTPASNTKLFTLYTAMHILGDSIPACKYRIVGDTLLIQGLGDPTFLHPDFDNQRIMEFLTHNGTPIGYCAMQVDDNPYGPGWAWDDYNTGYQRSRSELPVYGNVIHFEIDTITYTWRTNPVLRQSFLQDFSTDSTVVLKEIKREIDKNYFYLPPWNKQLFSEDDIPFIPQSRFVWDLLSDTLHKEVYKGNYLQESVWNVFYSHPVDTVYRKMMQESDNFIAEQLLWMSAAQKFDTLGSTKIIPYVLDSLLAKIPQRPRWVDGSGLSRYNLMTPLSLIYILNELYEEIELERLLSIFPAGGKSGTIENWYAGDTKPYVFAKTGTLSNNHNLSGYLRTSSGKLLVFSIMHNHYTIPVSEVKKEMEQMLRKLYNKF